MEILNLDMMGMLQVYLIVCPLVFLAGFIDSIAGGGGLIATPAYMLAGLPMHMVLGTNKAMSIFGTSVSMFRYIKSGNIHWRAAIVAAVGSFLGSAVGSRVALMIDADALKTFFVCILPFIALFVLFNKNKGDDSSRLLEGSKLNTVAFLVGVVTGAYDGLIGPGAGTFMIFGFTMFVGLDYIKSSGCAKVVNVASNVSAFITFVLAGKVIWALAIPAAA
ncbi:MAG: TSUP family transporter, partial [Oscillospiraceae bacterium]|nr:TSUP family transporter [Oscillospiraceae bacterium]